MNVSRKASLLFTVLITTLLFATWPGMNETSRYLLSKNIVSRGVFYIEEFYQTTDRSFYNGHYFSDKEPGVSFLITPIVWIGLSLEKMANIHSTSEFIIQKVENVEIKTPASISIFESITQIFSILLISGIPTALTTILIYKFSVRLTKKDDLSLTVSLAYLFGSLAFHYSLLLQPYAISTFFMFLAFFLSYFYKENRWMGFLIGMICGISGMIDLSSLPIAFLIVIYYFYSQKKINLYTLLGGGLAIFPFLLYNFINFGNPFTPPRFYLDELFWERIPGNHGIILDAKFNLISAIRMLIDPYRGLFVYYPIVFLCFLGWYENRRKYKAESLLIFAIFLASLFVGSSWWAWWHGATFGPKFLLISQPFLFLGLGMVLKKYKGLFIILLVLSVFTNLIGLTANYEDILKDIENDSLMKKEYEKIFYSFEFLPNVLKDYYLPQFLEWGPRSRVIETLLNGKLDIRAIEIPTPKYPFLPLFIYLSILSFLWWGEIGNLLAKLHKTISRPGLKAKRVKIKLHEFSIIVVLSFAFLNFLLVSFDILFYPFDVDYSEAFQVIITSRFLEGKNIYEIDKENLVVSKYPPLFYLLASPFLQVFGKNLFSLRLLSILFLLFSGIVIYKIVEMLTKRKTIALISFLSFFASFVTFDSVQLRADNVALFFFLFSVYLFLKKKYMLSLVFSTFSLLTKQTYFTPLLIFVLYFYIKRVHRKYMLIPFALIAGFLIVTIIAYNFDSIKNLLFFTKGITQFDQEVFYNFFSNLISILAIPLIYSLRTENSVIRWIILSTFLVSFIQFFRLGGWMYFFLPLQALFSISLGLLLDKERGVGVLGLLSLFALSIFDSFFYDPRLFLYVFQRHEYPPLVNVNSDLSLLDEIRNAKNPYIEHASYGIYLNRTMPEVWSYVELYRNQVITCNELIERFKKYDKIIFYSRVENIPCLYDFVRNNYTLARLIKWEDLAFHQREWYVYVRGNSS